MHRCHYVGIFWISIDWDAHPQSSFFVNCTRWMGSHQGDIKINIKVVQGWQENKSHPSSTKLLTCLVRGMRSLALCNTSQQTSQDSWKPSNAQRALLFSDDACLSTDFTARTYLSLQRIGVIVRYSRSIAQIWPPKTTLIHSPYSLCLKYFT